MILRMFAIYDVKADAYLQPFFLPAVGLALRAFEELVADQNQPIGRHPTDFSLFHFGHFDDGTGKFDLYEAPEFIVNGTTVLGKLQNDRRPPEGEVPMGDNMEPHNGQTTNGDAARLQPGPDC